VSELNHVRSACTLQRLPVWWAVINTWRPTVIIKKTKPFEFYLIKCTRLVSVIIQRHHMWKYRLFYDYRVHHKTDVTVQFSYQHSQIFMWSLNHYFPIPHLSKKGHKREKTLLSEAARMWTHHPHTVLATAPLMARSYNVLTRRQEMRLIPTSQKVIC
jgi:hypothetical protein